MKQAKMKRFVLLKINIRPEMTGEARKKCLCFRKMWLAFFENILYTDNEYWERNRKMRTERDKAHRYFDPVIHGAAQSMSVFRERSREKKK